MARDGDDDEPMSLPERRLRELLGPLAEEPGPDDPELPGRVARAARRQRAARRFIAVAGHFAAALADGLGVLARSRRS